MSSPFDPNPVFKPIGTRPQPLCYLCGSQGKTLYSGITDRLFGIPGEWNIRQCLQSTCGLLWLDPMPVEQDIPRLYSTYYTHIGIPFPTWLYSLYDKIAAGIFACRFGYSDPGLSVLWKGLGAILSLSRDFRDRFGGDLLWLHASERGRLLDFGCGNGTFLARMKNLGWDVTGIEPDPVARQRAIEKEGLEVYPGSLDDCHFPESSFDIVTLNHVIEHLPNPRKTLLDIKRIVHPHGKVIITTPNTVGWGHLHFNQDWRGLEPPRHLYLFNPDSLASLFQRAGFSINILRTTSRGSAYSLSMSRLLKRLPSQGIRSHHALLGEPEKQMVRILLYQICQSILLSWNPTRGENLLAVATPSDTPAPQPIHQTLATASKIPHSDSSSTACSRTLGQMIRFGLVGATGFIVGFTILNLLMFIGFGFVVANLMTFLLAVTWNFIWNRRITFPRAVSNPWMQQWVRYVSSCLIGAFVNWTVAFSLYFSSPFWKEYYNLPVVFGVLSGFMANFLLAKFCVFVLPQR